MRERGREGGSREGERERGGEQLVACSLLACWRQGSKLVLGAVPEGGESRWRGQSDKGEGVPGNEREWAMRRVMGWGEVQRISSYLLTPSIPAAPRRPAAPT